MSRNFTEVVTFDRVRSRTANSTPDTTPSQGRTGTGKRKAAADWEDCEVESTAKGAVKILSVDVDGKFVRLLNTAPEMVKYHLFYFLQRKCLAGG